MYIVLSCAVAVRRYVFQRHCRGLSCSNVLVVALPQCGQYVVDCTPTCVHSGARSSSLAGQQDGQVLVISAISQKSGCWPHQFISSVSCQSHNSLAALGRHWPIPCIIFFQYGQFPHFALGLRCFMIYIPVALVQGIVYVCVCTAIVIQFGRQFRDAGRELGISD